MSTYEVPTEQWRVDTLLLALGSKTVERLDVGVLDLDGLEVLSDTRSSNRLGQDDDALVHLVRDKDGGGCYLVLLGDPDDIGVGEERGV